ncbi:hypothetical protein AB3X52_02105 [Nocardioides sp. DS6]|uniref:Glycine zipper domain-containing protein n=1 Tax=Nocardioides eburneus TaxID=3231482 RepID=A0ABV3STY1_9ACTN
MFGRLPALHQALVILVGLAVGAVGGFWAARAAELPFGGSVGAGVGAALGILLAYAAVREPHHEHPHRMRVRRH